MTRIVLASDDPRVEHNVREAFDTTLNGALRRRSVNESYSGAADAVRGLIGPGEAPEVVILGPDLPSRMALALARSLDRERPDISVLVMAPRSAALLEEALRAGVRDVVAPDATGQALRQAVEHALEVASRRRSRLVAVPTPPPPSGQVIVVVSPKGGSGKTTVCASLAVGLAGVAGTALVDLDLQFGDVASALRLLPEATWVDVARTSDLDATSLKVFLTRHSSGLYALCAPDVPADGELVSVEELTGVLDLLAGEFRHVVVDTAAGLDEHTLAALERATDIVLVCSMDVPSVRSLRKEIAALDQLGLTGPRRHLVVNRADARVGLAIGDVEATVGMPVDVALPSSRIVPLALNQGVPVVESEPKSPVARELARLTGRFAPQEQPRAGGRLRRRKDGS